jgi:hypothetical protein
MRTHCHKLVSQPHVSCVAFLVGTGQGWGEEVA